MKLPLIFAVAAGFNTAISCSTTASSRPLAGSSTANADVGSAWNGSVTLAVETWNDGVRLAVIGEPGKRREVRLEGVRGNCYDLDEWRHHQRSVLTHLECYDDGITQLEIFRTDRQVVARVNRAHSFALSLSSAAVIVDVLALSVVSSGQHNGARWYAAATRDLFHWVFVRETPVVRVGLRGETECVQRGRWLACVTTHVSYRHLQVGFWIDMESSQVHCMSLPSRMGNDGKIVRVAHVQWSQSGTLRLVLDGSDNPRPIELVPPNDPSATMHGSCPDLCIARSPAGCASGRSTTH